MFYRPIVHKELKTIIYPLQGVETLHEYKSGDLEKLMQDVADLRHIDGDDIVLPFGRNNYSIVVVWADANKMRHDWFYFHSISQWPGNPSVDVYVFKNKGFLPREHQVTCGDSLIMLGIEEQHRKTTKSRAEYLRTRPDLPTPLRVGEVF
ncbi:MAG: hypothetical protein Q8L34_01240 [Candidatus Woesearchaeota archaeon]|nr:hypothetical protein [Candidatus Woesearchaeota archaeon]